MQIRDLLAGTFVLVLTLTAEMAGGTAVLHAQSSGGDAPTAPSEYLGYAVGSDFKLAKWDSITGYLNLLADESPALSVDTLGETTLGRPFVAVTLTARENMQRLGEIRENQTKLADPRRLGDGELERLVETQPAVIVIAQNIHATEIASSQGSMELAHELVTDPELRETLESVVVVLIPSVNPDGMDMVVDWYRRTVGTPYEGSGMPWLYHHYVGHDNNRDWFMLTQAETRLLTDLLYRVWFPEVVYDVHQMGNQGARFFVPPFDDPVNPNLDPLLVRMISLFGLQMSTDLEAAGKAGVANRWVFDLWWHGGNRTVPARHNMVGILSEAASARLASPIFQEPDDLRGAPEFGVNYPNPWPGGWWRIRDILDYQEIAAVSLIELASRRRPELIRNYVRLGRRAVEKGRQEPPFAYVVPADQRDPGAAARMLEILRLGGVEIHRATSPFTANSVEYPAGSRVVLMAQPYRAHAKDLLERQDYPDRREYPDGPPDPPYDVSGWTLPLQMGVETVAVPTPFEADLTLESDTIRPPGGAIAGTGPAYIVDHESNASHLAIHRVLAENGEALFVTEPVGSEGRSWPIGSVILRGPTVRGVLEPIAERHGLSAEAFTSSISGRRLDGMRVGLYQPWTASMDEGWTRYVFDEWEVPYKTLHDDEIQVGDLERRYDVILLPGVSRRALVEGRRTGTVPAEYAGGLGRRGVEALREFVESGGTLVCLDSSSEFAISDLGVPVRDVRPDFSEQRTGQAFYAPGSIFSVEIDTSDPLGYGMPERSAIYYANGPIFELHGDAEDVTVVARYPARGQLLSGYALHTEFLAGKPALLHAGVGDGRVVLFGFRPQHRGQPHETFKVLFNALYMGASTPAAALPASE